jgi:maleamate amidohydrolase
VEYRYLPSWLSEEDQSVYERAGWGKRVGFGERAAVIVIDMCRYFTEGHYPYSCPETGTAAAAAIADLLEVARPAGLPVIYTTQGDDRPYSPATAGRFPDKIIALDSSFATDARPHEIVPEVAPQADDVVLIKPKPSVFFGTQLESILNFYRVDTLIITGVSTSGCIRASVDHAFALNYRVILPLECVADRAQMPHEANLFDMDTATADVLPLEVVKHTIARKWGRSQLPEARRIDANSERRTVCSSLENPDQSDRTEHSGALPVDPTRPLSGVGHRDQ